MHRALRVAEIRALVAAECDSPSALARLASTARCFTEPALDSLYEEPSDFYDVFKTLPSDCWTTAGRGPKIFRITRPIKPEERRRLETYLSKVHRLSFVFDMDRQEGYSREELFGRATLPLFPKLRTLKIEMTSLSGRGLDFWFVVQALLNTELSSLDLGPSQSGGGTAVPQMLYKLHALCPRLLSLKIRNINRELIDSFAYTLPNLHHLEHLDVSWPYGWQAISNPGIQVLAITSDGFNNRSMHSPMFCNVTTLRLTTNVDALLGDISRPFFPSLEQLELRTNPRFLVSLLAKIRTAPLSSVKFHQVWNTRNEGLEITFRKIADALSAHSSLQHLSWTCYSQQDVVTVEDFLPLTRLKRLKSLELDIPDQVHLTGRDIERLLPAWPAIESLVLPNLYSDLSVEWLASFAKCPKLRSLLIGCRVIGAHIPRSYHGIQNTSLVTLDLNGPEVPSDLTCPLALFLSSLFPRLTSVEISDEDEWYERWLEVNAILRSIPKIREMERESLNRKRSIREGDIQRSPSIGKKRQ